MERRRLFQKLIISSVAVFTLAFAPLTAFAAPDDTTVASTTTTAAQSGDATVADNQTAGDATTGNATATVTAVTTADATVTSGNDAGFYVLNKTIDGNDVGDVSLTNLINGAAVQGQTVPVQAATDQGATVSTTVDASAISGNATVINNGQAGNATSGNAVATVNNATIVSSVISSPQTFVGTVNIYGTLTGDILVTPGLSPHTTPNNTALPVTDTPSTATINDSVTMTATSGNATVSNNQTAGNATSGNASTSLIVYHLVGQNINGTNSLIVLVNVIGKWEGAIVNMPAGSTTALLGTDMHQTVPSSQPNTPNEITIANSVTTIARSGNASVVNNGQAGNAQSGNATAVANLLTVANSDLRFANWFGILFINVYGTWFGSFGMDTPYGNPPNTPPTDTTLSVVTPSSTSNKTTVKLQPLPYTPTRFATPTATTTPPPVPPQSGVLGATTSSTSVPHASDPSIALLIALLAIGFGLVGLLGWLRRRRPAEDITA